MSTITAPAQPAPPLFSTAKPVPSLQIPLPVLLALTNSPFRATSASPPVKPPYLPTPANLAAISTVVILRQVLAADVIHASILLMPHPLFAQFVQTRHPSAIMIKMQKLSQHAWITALNVKMEQAASNASMDTTQWL
jgi:hypothetical protein